MATGQSAPYGDVSWATICGKAWIPRWIANVEPVAAKPASVSPAGMGEARPDTVVRGACAPCSSDSHEGARALKASLGRCASARGDDRDQLPEPFSSYSLLASGHRATGAPRQELDRPAATPEQAARSTSPTFASSSSAVNGFPRSATPSTSAPCRATASAL